MKVPQPKSKNLNENTETQVKYTNVVGYTPHKGQQRIHDAINSGNWKFYIVANGRQWGKTIMMINQMLYWGINEPKANIYYVSPTFKLARMVFTEMFNVISESGLLDNINKSNLIFTFTNGSLISFHSGERPDTLRGATISHLVLDEYAYAKKELWNDVLKPACLIKGRKVVFISTPNSKNHFFDLYMKGKSLENMYKNYVSFTAPSIDNPYIPKEELWEAEKNEIFYRQEYMAEFIDNNLTVFKNVKDCTYTENISINVPKKGVKYFIGIDLAQKDDFTCAVVMDENKKVVDMFHVRYTNWDFILKGLYEMYHKWNPVYGYLEVNFNERVFEELTDDYGCKKLQPFRTSAQSKTALIQDLILAFERKTISIPDVEYLQDELNVFSYKFNSNTGKVTYSAPSASHDDSVIALGLAYAALKEKGSTTGGFSWAKI